MSLARPLYRRPCQGPYLASIIHYPKSIIKRPTNLRYMEESIWVYLDSPEDISEAATRGATSPSAARSPTCRWRSRPSHGEWVTLLLTCFSCIMSSTEYQGSNWRPDLLQKCFLNSGSRDLKLSQDFLRNLILCYHRWEILSLCIICCM